jgi:hypothetical protein
LTAKLNARRRDRLLAPGLLCTLLLLACTEATTDLTPWVASAVSGGDGAAELGDPTGPLPDASEPNDLEDGSLPAEDAGPVAMCGRKGCKCDDGKDNDDDGLIDGFDHECTGAFDDDEASFATGKRGPKTVGPCQDCFWDEGADGLDDGCFYPNVCSENGVISEPIPPPVLACNPSCEVSTRCVDTCRNRTPNGCDCFGCCTVERADGASIDVVFAEPCSLAELDDDKQCKRCVKSPQCANECGPCELCPGRTEADLPASCASGGSEPASRCDEGYDVCTAQTECGRDYYCHLGCCLIVLE